MKYKLLIVAILLLSDTPLTLLADSNTVVNSSEMNVFSDDFESYRLDSNGLVDGEYRRGQLNSDLLTLIAHFDHGVLNGKYQAYAVSGSTNFLLAEGNFSEGHRTGKWVTYGGTKVLRIENFTVDGFPDGVWEDHSNPQKPKVIDLNVSQFKFDSFERNVVASGSLSNGLFTGDIKSPPPINAMVPYYSATYQNGQLEGERRAQSGGYSVEQHWEKGVKTGWWNIFYSGTNLLSSIFYNSNQILKTSAPYFICRGLTNDFTWRFDVINSNQFAILWLRGLDTRDDFEKSIQHRDDDSVCSYPVSFPRGIFRMPNPGSYRGRDEEDVMRGSFNAPYERRSGPRQDFYYPLWEVCAFNDNRDRNGDAVYYTLYGNIFACGSYSNGVPCGDWLMMSPSFPTEDGEFYSGQSQPIVVKYRFRNGKIDGRIEFTGPFRNGLMSVLGGSYSGPIIDRCGISDTSYTLMESFWRDGIQLYGRSRSVGPNPNSYLVLSDAKNSYFKSFSVGGQEGDSTYNLSVEPERSQISAFAQIVGENINHYETRLVGLNRSVTPATVQKVNNSPNTPAAKDVILVSSENVSYSSPPSAGSVIYVQNFSSRSVAVKVGFRLDNKAGWTSFSAILGPKERRSAFNGQTLYPQLEYRLDEAHFQ